jgi:hypothetical protein
MFTDPKYEESKNFMNPQEVQPLTRKMNDSLAVHQPHRLVISIKEDIYNLPKKLFEATERGHLLLPK